MVHDTNANRISASAIFEPTRQSEAARIASIGHALAPLMTAPRSGTARIRAKTRKIVTAPPTASVQIMARGTLRDGSWTSSAMSPQASKP